MSSIVVAFPATSNPQEVRPMPMAACWAICAAVSIASWALVAQIAFWLF